jgi:hypothetical protein
VRPEETPQEAVATLLDATQQSRLEVGTVGLRTLRMVTVRVSGSLNPERSGQSADVGHPRATTVKGSP